MEQEERSDKTDARDKTTSTGQSVRQSEKDEGVGEVHSYLS